MEVFHAPDKPLVHMGWKGSSGKLCNGYNSGRQVTQLPFRSPSGLDSQKNANKAVPARVLGIQ